MKRDKKNSSKIENGSRFGSNGRKKFGKIKNEISVI